MCVGEKGLERGKNVSWETRSSSFIQDTILDSGITVEPKSLPSSVFLILGRKGSSQVSQSYQLVLTLMHEIRK